MHSEHPAPRWGPGSPESQDTSQVGLVAPGLRMLAPRLCHPPALASPAGLKPGPEGPCLKSALPNDPGPRRRTATAREESRRRDGAAAALPESLSSSRAQRNPGRPATGVPQSPSTPHSRAPRPPKSRNPPGLEFGSRESRVAKSVYTGPFARAHTHPHTHTHIHTQKSAFLHAGGRAEVVNIRGGAAI